MNQELCKKIRALGIKRGKVSWNGAVLNRESNCYKRGTGIIVSIALSHTIINKGILIEGKVQFLIYKLDNLKIGFMNIYTPNRGKERVEFWDQINAQLPTMLS